MQKEQTTVKDMKTPGGFWRRFGQATDNWIGRHRRAEIFTVWFGAYLALTTIPVWACLMWNSLLPIEGKVAMTLVLAFSLPFVYVLFQYSNERWARNWCADMRDWRQTQDHRE